MLYMYLSARQARAEEKEAKKWAKWHSQGWQLNNWQKKQVRRLETHELTSKVRSANAAYGFGKGAEETMSRAEAFILEVFTAQHLQEYIA